MQAMISLMSKRDVLEGDHSQGPWLLNMRAGWAHRAILLETSDGSRLDNVLGFSVSPKGSAGRLV